MRKSSVEKSRRPGTAQPEVDLGEARVRDRVAAMAQADRSPVGSSDVI